MQLPKLRYWRERRALTQVELAQKAGVSVRSLAGYEAAEFRARPSAVRKLAEALDVDVTALMDAEPQKVQTLPVDIDEFKQAAIDREKPETLRELQTLVEEALEQRYSSTELLTLKDELTEIRTSLAPVKDTHFDDYARVVEAENFVRRVLNKVAGRVAN